MITVLLPMLAYGESLSPRLKINELTRPSVEQGKQDLLDAVNAYERNLIVEAFEAFDAYAEKEDSLEVWKFLDGKVPIEIFQHAVLLNHDFRSSIWIDSMKHRIERLREMANDDSLPMDERKKLASLANEEEERIKEVQTVGLPILSGNDVECKGYWNLRNAQTKSIQGKWHSLLFERLKDSDRIEIVSTSFSSVAPGQKLHSIQGKDRILEFLELVKIDEEDSGYHCMCDGDALLEFYHGDEKVADLSYHHGQGLRWNNGRWIGDASISEDRRSELLAWFTSQGYSTFEEANEKQ